MNFIKNFIINHKKLIIIIAVSVILLLAIFFIIKMIQLNLEKNEFNQSKREIKYYYMSKQEEVFPVANIGLAKEVPIQIFIKPGLYNFYGKTYDLEKEGLYVFSDEYGIYHRILYRKNVWAVISALAWLDTPSAKTSKETLSNTDLLIKQIQISNIDLSCGQISNFTDGLLQKIGFVSRSIMGFNPDLGKVKGVTSGHNMLEIKIDKKWHLVDIDNNVYFQKNGKDLNFKDFIELVKNDQSYEMIHLAVDENDKSDVEIKAYYKQIFKVALISDEKNYYFTADEATTQKVNDYARKYKWLAEDSWLAKFYSS